jgi:hypothetical protein
MPQEGRGPDTGCLTQQWSQPAGLRVHQHHLFVDEVAIALHRADIQHRELRNRLQLASVPRRRYDRNPLLERDWFRAAQLLPNDRALLGGNGNQACRFGGRH